MKAVIESADKESLEIFGDWCKATDDDALCDIIPRFMCKATDVLCDTVPRYSCKATVDGLCVTLFQGSCVWPQKSHPLCDIVQIYFF